MSDVNPATTGQAAPDRHVQLGVSHPSDDPARHRVFEVRAAYSEAAGGWVARWGEQNVNEQFQGWETRLSNGEQERAFATPAACFGGAVASIIALVDRESDTET